MDHARLRAPDHGVRGRGDAASLGAVLAAVAAGAAFAVALYDRRDVTNRADAAGELGSLLQVGWGLNLTMVASGIAVVASITMLFLDSRPPGPRAAVHP